MDSFRFYNDLRPCIYERHLRGTTSQSSISVEMPSVTEEVLMSETEVLHQDLGKQQPDFLTGSFVYRADRPQLNRKVLVCVWSINQKFVKHKVAPNEGFRQALKPRLPSIIWDPTCGQSLESSLWIHHLKRLPRSWFYTKKPTSFKQLRLNRLIKSIPQTVTELYSNTDSNQTLVWGSTVTAGAKGHWMSLLSLISV